MKTKKLSESFQAENLQGKKENSFVSYDFESLPELNKDQIKSFKRISKVKHEKFKTAVKNHVGRPKKDPNEKENIVPMRFSKNFLDRFKKKAKLAGYTHWQTYAKYILEKSISK